MDSTYTIVQFNKYSKKYFGFIWAWMGLLESIFLSCPQNNYLKISCQVAPNVDSSVFVILRMSMFSQIFWRIFCLSSSPEIQTLGTKISKKKARFCWLINNQYSIFSIITRRSSDVTSHANNLLRISTVKKLFAHYSKSNETPFNFHLSFCVSFWIQLIGFWISI